MELRPRRISLRCAYRADVPVPSPPCSGQENEHCSTAMEGIYTPTHGCLPAVLFRPAACDQFCFIRGQCEPERQPKKVGSHQQRLSSDIDSGIEVPIHKVHSCGSAGGTHEYQDCENSCPQCPFRALLALRTFLSPKRSAGFAPSRRSQMFNTAQPLHFLFLKLKALFLMPLFEDLAGERGTCARKTTYVRVCRHVLNASPIRPVQRL